MPWRQLPPDWMQWLAARMDELMLYMSLVAAVMLGTLTKVAAEVRDGIREKFLSSRLLLDVPAVLMMASVAYGVAEFAELTPGAASAVGCILGYVGPKAASLLIHAVADRIRGGR